MRILLDTHLLLWWLWNSPQLTASARTLIANPDNTIFVSAVSLWEIRLKQGLGKLRVPEDFDQRLAAESFEQLPLTGHQTRALVELPWHHRDPFDRMLVAQALTERLRLATADPKMWLYSDTVLLMQ